MNRGGTQDQGISRLEATRRKLIADCNFWLSLRDRLRAEVLKRTGKTEGEMRDGAGEGGEGARTGAQGPETGERQA
jgi:hypothetical protein